MGRSGSDMAILLLMYLFLYVTVNDTFDKSYKDENHFFIKGFIPLNMKCISNYKYIEHSTRVLLFSSLRFSKSTSFISKFYLAA